MSVRSVVVVAVLALLHPVLAEADRHDKEMSVGYEGSEGSYLDGGQLSVGVALPGTDHNWVGFITYSDVAGTKQSIDLQRRTLLFGVRGQLRLRGDGKRLVGFAHFLGGHVWNRKGDSPFDDGSAYGAGLGVDVVAGEYFGGRLEMAFRLQGDYLVAADPFMRGSFGVTFRHERKRRDAAKP